jgi:hypothetical protein
MNIPPPRRLLEAYTRQRIPADPGLGRRASGNGRSPSLATDTGSRAVY